MPEFSIASLPEVFVSDASISKAVYEAAERGQLRKLGSRLYTRNLDEDPERLVRRKWYYLVTAYYPDALIADRTALDNKPADDGSVFLISQKKREATLPGIVFRPRAGAGPLESDRPFIGRARLASTARAYLENMRPSRERGGGSRERFRAGKSRNGSTLSSAVRAKRRPTAFGTKCGQWRQSLAMKQKHGNWMPSLARYSARMRPRSRARRV